MGAWVRRYTLMLHGGMGTTLHLDVACPRSHTCDREEHWEAVQSVILQEQGSNHDPDAVKSVIVKENYDITRIHSLCFGLIKHS